MYKEYHEQACKKINEIHIKVHDTFANFFEGKLRKYHRASKVTAGNENRSLEKKRADVELTVNGRKVYSDIGISFDPEGYYGRKQKHYVKM